MIRKRLLLVPLAFCIALLSACATPFSGKAAASGDRLIGFYVTTDSVQSDNARMEATATTVPQTDAETGAVTERTEYVFEGLPGYGLFLFHDEDANGEQYELISHSDAITDIVLNMGEVTEMTGTLYALPRAENTVFPNRVYQASDGTVYLTPEAGYAWDGADVQGENLSLPLEETQTVTEAGKTHVRQFRATLTVATKFPTQSVRILEMRDDATVCGETNFDTTNCPTQLAPAADAAYLIVESTLITPSGEQVEHMLLTPADDHCTVYAAMDEYMYAPREIALDWGSRS